MHHDFLIYLMYEYIFMLLHIITFLMILFRYEEGIKNCYRLFINISLLLPYRRNLNIMPLILPNRLILILLRFMPKNWVINFSVILN